MRRIVAILQLGILAGLVAACQSNGGATIPAPVPIRFQGGLDRAAWPVQWQATHDIEAVYPMIPPEFDKRFAEGERFLNEVVEIDADFLARAASANLHGAAKGGVHSALVFSFTPEGVDFKIHIEEVREGHSESTDMLVDSRLRLKDYTAKRVRRTGETFETTFQRAIWDKDASGRTIYRINSGGRDREVRTEVMLVPEDLLFLLPLFAPKTAYTANFKLLAIPFGGIYRCDLRVRPSADPALGRRILEIYPHSPLGEEHRMILNADNQIESGRTTSGISFTPLATTDLNRFDNFFALRRRERDSLLFNGQSLYSHFGVGGDQVVSIEAKPAAESWLVMDTAGLDLLVAPSLAKDTDLVAELVDRTTLDAYNKAISAKDLEAIAGARSLQNADARHLQVKLDYRPRRDKSDDYASIIVARATEEGEVENYRREKLTINGQAAERIEFVLRKFGRIDKQLVKSPPLFRSILLINAGSVVVNITISIGADWQKYTGGLRKIQESVRVLTPEMNGTKR